MVLFQLRDAILNISLVISINLVSQLGFAQAYQIPDSILDNDDLYDLPLDGYIYKYFGATDNASFNEIKSSAKWHLQDETDSVAQSNWFKFTIQGDELRDQFYFLKLNPELNRASVYVDDTLEGYSLITKRSGRHLLPSEKEVVYFNQNYIKLDLKAGVGYNVWINIEDSPGISNLHVSLKPKAQFEQYMRFNDIYKAVFTAIFIVLALYNLLLYFTINELSFLYYSIMVFALGIHASLTFFFERFSILLVGELSIVIASLIVFGGMRFNDRFLRCRRYQPKWHQVFNFIAYVAICNVVVQSINIIFFNNEFVDDKTSIVAAFLALMLAVFSLIVGIVIYLKGEKRGRHFLLINIPVFLGSMVYLVYWSGINVFEVIRPSPYQVVFASFSFYGSVTIQIILLSIIVGYNIKGLEKEKLEIQRNINKELAKQVEVRTSTLNEANLEIEAQKEKLKDIISVKDRLFSIISHDLRSPMNSLNGVVQLLKTKSLTSGELDHLAISLEQKVKGTSQLLDNLLYWSKSQMSGMHIEPEKVDVVKIIDKNINLITPELSEKNITVVKNIEKDSFVFADLNMIDLVIRNLLANAVKFSYDKHKITISTNEIGSHLEIKIKDTGKGISHEDQDKLFDSSYVFSSVGTHNEKGTGLGLALCKDFLLRNHGSIRLESKLNAGTAVTISIPRHNNNAE